MLKSMSKKKILTRGLDSARECASDAYYGRIVAQNCGIASRSWRTSVFA